MPGLSNTPLLRWARPIFKLLPARWQQWLLKKSGWQPSMPAEIKGDLVDIFHQVEWVAHKWPHYFPIYQRHLAHLRGQPIRVLEIGVFHGGSLEMWQRYFGPQARIVGMDINPACQVLNDHGFEVIIGDQSDPAVLQGLIEKYAPFDLVMDDGSHLPQHVLASFNALFPHLKEGGIYLIEDTHTAYWPDYQGGLGLPGTATSWAKDLIDQLHAFHSREPQFTPTPLSYTVGGLHCYDSILVIDKKTRKDVAKSVLSGIRRVD